MKDTDANDTSSRFTSRTADEWLGKKIQCLDHGFVYLVDYMGGDPSIVQAARVSYGLGTKSVSEDRGLIRYLMRHHHTTPFEMVELKFHVKLPIFVARQWIRHRTACLSGDTRLAFDLPGTRHVGQRPHHLTIGKFHRLWHEGSTRPIRKKRPFYMARVPMRELLGRMRLRMCDESTGEIAHTRVVDVWESGIRPVYRVTLENGSSIKMTPDHRCLTEQGWMTLGAATRVRRREDGGVTWDGGAPALAVNGEVAYRDRDWVAAQRSRGHDVATIARSAGTSYHTIRKYLARYLVRAFSKVARIEFAGHEMTYDLAVSGPFHNFVANGFIVHNSVNEYSGRYSIMPDEFYLPRAEEVTVQSTANRQGGGECIDAERAAQVLDLLRQEQTLTRQGYEKMLDLDLRRELARINLGVSQYTEWYWKNDLHNVFRFLELRLDPHAQYEIRVYAEAMAQIVRAVAPVAWEAFEDYRLGAERFSRLELEALARLLDEPGWPGEERVREALPEPWREVSPRGALKRNRERDEFLAKLKRLAERRRPVK